MKTCPTCRQVFPNALPYCPADGTPLGPLPPDLDPGAEGRQATSVSAAFRAERQKARLGQRLQALLLDAVVILLAGGLLGLGVGYLLGSLVGGALQHPATHSDLSGVGGLYGAVGGILLGVGFFTLLTALMEATMAVSIGKTWLGLRIVGEDGGEAPFRSLLLRTLLKFSPLMAFGIGGPPSPSPGSWGHLVGLVLGLGLVVSLLLHPRHPTEQALHDRLAGTLLVVT